MTEELNILYEKNWKRTALQELEKFQKELQAASLGCSPSWNGGVGQVDDVVVQDGTSDGSEWSLASSFLYSLSLITTVGNEISKKK